MITNRIQSRGPSQGQSHSLLVLLSLLLLIAGGCGQGDGGKPTSGEPSIQITPPPTVTKLTPEAARMELAKLNKDYSQNAFMASATEGDKLAVELFLAAGMDPNTKDANGATALMLACFRGRKDVVGKLLASGADFDVRLKEGTSALLIACEQGHHDIVLVLLNRYPRYPKRGLGYNAMTGSYPMKWAAKNGWADVVRLLLEKDRDDIAVANLQDSDNKTALDYAKDGGHTEIVRLLQEVHDRVEKNMGR